MSVNVISPRSISGRLLHHLLLLLVLLLAKGTAVSRVAEFPRADTAQDFLEKYGYLRQEEHKHSSAELDSALREFQWLSQLPVTGQLDSVTLQQMGAPRCGVRDGRSHRAWSHRINGLLKGEVATTSGHRRMKRYARTGDRWHKRHLTYRIVNGPRHLSTGQVRLAVRAAFQLWSNVSALAFREVAEGPADIRLAFFEGEHDDGTGNAFDGPGGALAHAFFPCRGEAHFDMAERWTLHSRKGHNLFMVVAHEIGHTLGLEHSPLRRALMSPYYRKLGKALVLSWDDIIAVQQLYGKPADGKLTQSSGRAFMSALQDWEQTQTEEDRGSSPPLYCEGTFDAITMDEDETVLVFRGGLFWVVSPQGDVSAPAPLQRRWPQLPPTIEAAAFSPVDGKFYFFKGRRLWRYSNSSLDPGFPRNHAEASLPRRPDCAFYYPPLGHMILFKSSQYFVLNLKTLLPEPYYPRGLEDWKGLPRGTHGALSRSDGHLYVFKGHRYWQFNLAKVRVSGHGIWAQDLQWVGCQKTRSVNDVL
ncbi:matrix metalloproteinase-28 isoform X2 [Brienomyrus brachyistius]|uniref:matrix metalloproteinase-28 isoform X2 n=1 Tax=Brienomyrus brachyistius TaxID=42636 RepID=UPI0020B34717|nr:matrix metalloproteinase-28 isoform X2 [Brienomyrus brachyistius]